MWAIYLSIIVIGLILVIYGITLLIKELKLKDIVEFDVSDIPKSVNFMDTGLHSICLIGIGHKYRFQIKKIFNLSITAPDGKSIITYTPNYKSHFIRKGVICMEIAGFNIVKSGHHSFDFIGLSDVIKHKSTITSDEVFINREFEIHQLKVLIKESVPYKNHFLKIFSLIIGSISVVLGMILLLS
ncbi:MAG: hypothetical protein ED556_01850 [Winogradskyella sp.]|uniref:hypothetical protein n=1 Tax=Winogradskyella sp. TaxID=1883156 RepID=UPI000F3DC44C|nr:hypothetical protein [Winogradskyella sp.]RNC87956.1 MAG: hypothetical protein ED556_01850 [Winogradskyella sp.]